MATEVVLFDKLDENEVVEAIDFGIKSAKKIAQVCYTIANSAGAGNFEL
ncbi:MAG: hypothetical protein LBO71_02300 [Prevotellaceae bacterium]|jgi:hypothetical protein|nr:hypothetical protein [Prevotellaceae bacterium]